MRKATYLVVAGMIIALITGCGSKSGPDTSSTSASTPAAKTTASSGAGGTVKISADKSGALKFDQKTVTAKAGKVTISFANPSQVQHDVLIESGEKELGGTKAITAGTATTTLNLKPGKYKFYCNVDGHEQAGMVGSLIVK